MPGRRLRVTPQGPRAAALSQCKRRSTVVLMGRRISRARLAGLRLDQTWISTPPRGSGRCVPKSRNPLRMQICLPSWRCTRCRRMPNWAPPSPLRVCAQSSSLVIIISRRSSPLNPKTRVIHHLGQWKKRPLEATRHSSKVSRGAVP